MFKCICLVLFLLLSTSSFVTLIIGESVWLSMKLEFPQLILACVIQFVVSLVALYGYYKVDFD
jgi:hypothetical protein